MMAVDCFIKQNGRQFISMQGFDGERTGFPEKLRKSARRIEVTDLMGRKYEDFPIWSEEDER